MTEEIAEEMTTAHLILIAKIRVARFGTNRLLCQATLRSTPSSRTAASTGRPSSSANLVAEGSRTIPVSLHSTPIHTETELEIAMEKSYAQRTLTISASRSIGASRPANGKAPTQQG